MKALLPILILMVTPQYLLAEETQENPFPKMKLEASAMYQDSADTSGSPFKTNHIFKDTERKTGGMVFFRGAYIHFLGDRGAEVFTDTLGTTRQNDDDNGWSMGAGLDLDLGHDLLFGNLHGEVFVEYSQISRKEVRQATSTLLGGTNTSRLTVAQLNVTIAPKVVWDFDWVRPWLIPVGLSFLVNSPPSNDGTYLDVGAHFGVGAEFPVLDSISLGVDFRYTNGFGQSDTETDYLSTGLYLGVSF